jgi:hypothetical protein
LLTGFNTDIEFGGKTYHVQTEDREGDDRIFESLVYVQGRILDAYRTRYANLIDKGYDEDSLASVLEAQHKRIIRWIKNGRYDPEAVQPFGEGIITDRSFDDVVLEFLKEEVGQEELEIRVEELGNVASGWTGALRVTLRSSRLNRPLADAPVMIELERPSEDKPVRLFHGISDRKGVVLAEVTLPDAPEGSQVRVVVDTELGVVESRLPLPNG